MNPNLEMTDEPMTETPLVEVLTEEQVTALQDPDALKQQLEVCRTRFVTLRPIDELTAKQCAALVETCTFAARHAESRRTEIVGPHNKIVKDANLVWQPIVQGFEALSKTKAAEVAKWIDEERKAAQREQQRLIDEAKARQDELDRKAQAERDEADRIRREADQAKTIEEAERLHKQADQLEKKADKDELKASQVVTQVVPAQSKTIDLGSSTLSTKAPKNTWMLAGYDKAKPLKLTDPKLSALVGDLSKLPENLQFLLKHSDINPVYLNKSFGVIEFPAPFAVVPDYGGSQVRGK
jgi:hypothetical protein